MKDLTAFPLDYLAGLAEIVGLVLVGNFCRYGFLLCLACNVLWIAVAIQSGLHGLIPVSVVMVVINTRNFIKWSRTPNSRR